MKLKLRIWRQATPNSPGQLHPYEVEADPRMSWLELLDHLNQQLLAQGKPPVAFDSDCREGICGACGLLINGRPHGTENNQPACHQRVGHHRDGTEITIEPLRARQFPVIADLSVDRTALDHVLAAGAWTSLNTGTAPDADTTGTTHDQAEHALDMAACIGCGACVAACPNNAAHLFAGAKLAHLATTPIPARERTQRAKQIQNELTQIFGGCTLSGDCTLVCPANIDLTAVAWINKEKLYAR
ncbi:MAG: succinate dehydrogenase/fumarate reductase iron-sulfur subunit [Actinomycetaceae bacterium]|nr:succinate dehydrogenase/fumarate reductase iron-sulfur subunit [Actinomycetaceae bacterium]